MPSMKNILHDIGIVPVIKITDAEKSVDLASALVCGGLPAAEITFRTAAAADAIYRMKNAFPEMLIGAGTVLTIDNLNAAVSAGASFIVAPGLNPKIVEASLQKNVPVVPGCMTPSEIECAMELGLDFVKFFPAEAAGGVKMLKAMSAPYGGISFMPTGGITLSNAADYLSLKSVVCCGGSFIAKEKAISEGDFDLIRSRAEETAEFVKTLRQK